MALEWRGNNLYYYEKERRNGRVVSVYSGRGEIAQLLHQCKRLEREEETIRRSLVLEERENCEQVNSIVESFDEEVRALEESLFLINGYRKHSRTWRRRKLTRD